MAVHTIKGVKLNLGPQQFDDMELLEQLSEIQDGNPLVFPKVMLRLAGGSKKKRDEIYDALDRVYCHCVYVFLLCGGLIRK